jgi:hypothetical protein
MAAHPEHSERPWRVDLVAITLDGRNVVTRMRHIEDAVVAG